MLRNGAAMMVEVLLGCALLIGSIVLLRLRQLDMASMMPTIDSSEAVRIYQKRIQATDIMLRQDRLEQDGL